jgi:hypothetical protein
MNRNKPFGLRGRQWYKYKSLGEHGQRHHS